MADQTTAVPALIRKAYRAGYQDAIDAMRLWHERFGKAQSRSEFMAAAAMIEAAKPSDAPTFDNIPYRR